jgi:hypothetical protein
MVKVRLGSEGDLRAVAELHTNASNGSNRRSNPVAR